MMNIMNRSMYNKREYIVEFLYVLVIYIGNAADLLNVELSDEAILYSML